MTESATAHFAESVTNAHEEDNPLDLSDQKNLSPEEIRSQQEASRLMDVYNNATGRAVGLRHEGDRPGIIHECVEMARNAPIVPGEAALTALGGSNGFSLVIQRDMP